MIGRGVYNFHASKLYIKMYNLVNNHEYKFIVSKNVIWCIHTDLIFRCVSYPPVATQLANSQWPLLLTWFNFNPSMEK